MSGKVSMADEYITEDGPKKVSMATNIDRSEIKDAYEEVRSDSSPTDWAIFKFEGSSIVCSVKGEGFEDFRAQFADDERAFAYLRLQMGDEMSKRKKFLFITWIGPSVGVMKRAKMSTDKAKMKEILSQCRFPERARTFAAPLTPLPSHLASRLAITKTRLCRTVHPLQQLERKYFAGLVSLIKMIVDYDSDVSTSSEASTSEKTTRSRSHRRAPLKGVIYFHSDQKCALVENLQNYFEPGDVVATLGEYVIDWKGKMEKIVIIKLADKHGNAYEQMEILKKSADLFDELKDSNLFEIKEILLLAGDAIGAAKALKKRQDKEKRMLEKEKTKERMMAPPSSTPTLPKTKPSNARDKIDEIAEDLFGPLVYTQPLRPIENQNTVDMALDTEIDKEADYFSLESSNQRAPDNISSAITLSTSLGVHYDHHLSAYSANEILHSQSVQPAPDTYCPPPRSFIRPWAPTEDNSLPSSLPTLKPPRKALPAPVPQPAPVLHQPAPLPSNPQVPNAPQPEVISPDEFDKRILSGLQNCESVPNKRAFLKAVVEETKAANEKVPLIKSHPDVLIDRNHKKSIEEEANVIKGAPNTKRAYLKLARLLFLKLYKEDEILEMSGAGQRGNKGLPPRVKNAVDAYLKQFGTFYDSDRSKLLAVGCFNKTKTSVEQQRRIMAEPEFKATLVNAAKAANARKAAEKKKLRESAAAEAGLPPPKPRGRPKKPAA